MAEISEPRKLSLVEMKARAQAKTEHDKENARIKRDILVLTLEFLRNNGYIDSCQRLQSESGISLAKWQGADNMDLRLIISEFEAFFKIKYGKQPKLTRKSDNDEEPPRAGGGGVKAPRPQSMYAAPSYATAAESSPTAAPNNQSNQGNSSNAQNNAAKFGRRASTATPKSVNSLAKGNQEKEKNPDELSLGVIGLSSPSEAPAPTAGIRGGRVSAAQLNSIHGVALNAIEDGSHIDQYNNRNVNAATDGDDGEGGEQYDHRLLKPMPQYSGQLRELADVIAQDIYTNNPNCRWDDIVGLGEAKQLVQEAVIMPIKYPQIFTGLLSPWKGILLYGPPGTGKTMLARAVATECNTTFFNISASSIVSKFRGDSEKLVRVLFDMARFHAPSTIFLDEIDSIMGNRDAAGEHEASRRMKTELLVQMDGLAKSNDLVFVLAASNHPWHLDVALLRRLEKRILVPLPDVDARFRILSNNLYENQRSNADSETVRQIAVQTEGYSGADLVLLCKEAAMRPVRRLMVQVREAEKARRAEIEANARKVWEQQEREEREKEKKGRKGALQHGKRVLGDPEEIVRKMLAEAPEPEVQLDPVTRDDILAAVKCTKPVTDGSFLQRYEKWSELHGNGYTGSTEADMAGGVGPIEEE